MSLTSIDGQWKIILLGNSGVGKTNIVHYYAKRDGITNLHSNDDENDNVDRIDHTYASQPTVNVDYVRKTVDLTRGSYDVHIWDTAGQERYQSLVKAYYRGIHGALLVYDVTDEESFSNCQFWLSHLCKHCDNPERVIVGLVANKTDLLQQKRELSEIDLTEVDTGDDDGVFADVLSGKTFAQDNHLFFFQTSAKTGRGIDNAFLMLLDAICEQQSGRFRVKNDGSADGDYFEDISLDDERTVYSVSNYNVREEHLRSSRRTERHRSNNNNNNKQHNEENNALLLQKRKQKEEGDKCSC